MEHAVAPGERRSRLVDRDRGVGVLVGDEHHAGRRPSAVAPHLLQADDGRLDPRLDPTAGDQLAERHRQALTVRQRGRVQVPPAAGRAVDRRGPEPDEPETRVDGRSDLLGDEADVVADGLLVVAHRARLVDHEHDVRRRRRHDRLRGSWRDDHDGQRHREREQQRERAVRGWHRVRPRSCPAEACSHHAARRRDNHPRRA